MTDPNQNSQSQRGGSKRNNRFNSVLEQVREPYNPDAGLDEPVRLADINEESADSGELELSAFHENLVKTLDLQIHQVMGYLHKMRINGGTFTVAPNG